VLPFLRYTKCFLSLTSQLLIYIFQAFGRRMHLEVVSDCWKFVKPILSLPIYKSIGGELMFPHQERNKNISLKLQNQTYVKYYSEKV
jgi:hypothetical protein